MIEIQVWKHADSSLRAASPLDLKLIQSLERGEKYIARLQKPRSLKQNNLFHGLIQRAYENQTYGPRLESWEALKGWLLVRAGHCEETAVSVKGMLPSTAAVLSGAVAGALRQRTVYAETLVDRARAALIIRTPRSVSFAKADRETMQPVVDRVVDLICSEIVPGVTPEQLMDMAKRRAA